MADAIGVSVVTIWTWAKRGKYLDHQPLERQVRTMARDGLQVDSQTLSDQRVIARRRRIPESRSCQFLVAMLLRPPQLIACGAPATAGRVSLTE
jgi:hypothetical protein